MAANSRLVLFLPVWLSFVVGQDVSLTLLACGVASALFASGRDRLGGFVFSFCVIKFHLFVLTPIALAAHRRWGAFLGASIGISAWFGLSTLACGPRWFQQYLRLLQEPGITPDRYAMTNIPGQFGGALAICLGVVTLALFLFGIVRLAFPDAFVLSIAGGLLLNTHSYVSDYVLLLPALALAIEHRRVRWVAAFLITPIPYVLLLLGHGSVLVLSVVALAACWLWTHQTYQPAEGPPDPPSVLSVAAN